MGSVSLRPKGGVFSRLLDEWPLLLRTLVASISTYATIDLLYPGNADMTGTLTALLVSQGSVVGTLRSVFDRVAAVVLGVSIAVWLGHWLGMNLTSLTIAISLSLLLGVVGGFKDNRLEIPISAMLVLAASSQDVASEIRMLNTFIGAGMGMFVTLVFPTPPKLNQALVRVGSVVETTATVAADVARKVEGRSHTPAEGHLQDVARIIPEVESAKTVVRELRSSYLLNSSVSLIPTMRTHKVDLMNALDVLESCFPSLQQLIISLEMDEALPAEQDAEVREELRSVYASVLDSVSEALKAFSNFVVAAPEEVSFRKQEFERTLRQLYGARCLLAELTMLPVEDATEAVSQAFLKSVDSIHYHLSLGGSGEFNMKASKAVREKTREVLNSSTIRKARRVKFRSSRRPGQITSDLRQQWSDHTRNR